MKIQPNSGNYGTYYKIAIITYFILMLIKNLIFQIVMKYFFIYDILDLWILPGIVNI